MLPETDSGDDGASLRLAEDSRVRKAARAQPRGSAAPPANPAAELAAASASAGTPPAGGLADGLRLLQKRPDTGSGQARSAELTCDMRTAHYRFNL